MRINLFGGPGSGKSTTAAYIFSRLKKMGYSVEQVSEYVKAWAYQKRSVEKFDQVYIFGKQMQCEYKFLNNGVEHIITDCPVLLSYIYSVLYKTGLGPSILQIIKEYERDHPSINIFLKRGNKPYDTKGRYQTYEQAKELDELIKDSLRAAGMGFYEIPYENEEQILETIVNELSVNQLIS